MVDCANRMFKESIEYQQRLIYLGIGSNLSWVIGREGWWGFRGRRVWGAHWGPTTYYMLGIPDIFLPRHPTTSQLKNNSRQYVMRHFLAVRNWCAEAINANDAAGAKLCVYAAKGRGRVDIDSLTSMILGQRSHSTPVSWMDQLHLTRLLLLVKSCVYI